MCIIVGMKLEWAEGAPLPKFVRRKRRPLGEASLDFIESALRQGRSLREIAKALDTTLTVVRRAVEENKNSRFIFLLEREAEEKVKKARLKYQLASEEVAEKEIRMALDDRTPPSVRVEYIRGVKESAGLTKRTEAPQQVVFIDARKLDNALKGMEEVFGSSLSNLVEGES